MGQDNKRKQKMLKQKEQDIFDSKIFFKRYAKRYLIIIAIALLPIIGINILLSYLAPGIEDWIRIILNLVLLAAACFIGLVIFNKIDERRIMKPPPKEKERDPFSD